MLILDEPWDGRFAFIFVIIPGHLTNSFCHLFCKICQFFEKKNNAGGRGWGMGNAGINWCITIFKTIINHNLPVQFKLTYVKLHLKAWSRMCLHVHLNFAVVIFRFSSLLSSLSYFLPVFDILGPALLLLLEFESSFFIVLAIMIRRLK